MLFYLVANSTPAYLVLGALTLMALAFVAGLAMLAFHPHNVAVVPTEHRLKPGAATLVPVADRRKGGTRRHNDWDQRPFHKKCWKQLHRRHGLGDGVDAVYFTGVSAGGMGVLVNASKILEGLYCDFDKIGHHNIPDAFS